MSRFLNFLKKFFKWTAIVVVILMVIAFFSARYSDHKYQIANTVDEEIGLLCGPTKNDGNLRFIFQSTPNSRGYSWFWENIKVVRHNKSEVNEGKTESWFVNADNIRRTLDYVIAEDSIVTFKFNRENFGVSLYRNNKEPEEFISSFPCEVVDAKDIRDFVQQNNEASNSTNIL